jgi:iron complex outermembrane receptor protein
MVAVAAAPAAYAQAQYNFNLPAQTLAESLQAVARQSGANVIFNPASIAGVRAPAVKGTLSSEAALRRLVEGAGLTLQRTQGGSFVVKVADQGDRVDTQAEADTLEEIVVTAQKREERLVDVPMSIVALGGRELEKRHVNSLLDLTREAPGLSIQDQGVGQRRMFMRGVGNVFGTSSLVGLYLDDASVSGIQDGEIDLRPYDLARVEVLRGPQGTLYGEGSTAGTVRFITNSPDLDAIGGHAKYTASVTEHGGMSNEFTGALNLPIVPGKFGIRLSGLLQDAAGWIDQPEQNHKDINDQKLSDLRLIATVQPTEDLRFRFTGIRHRNEAGAPNTVSNSEGDFIQVLGETAIPHSQDNYDFLNATVTYQLGGVQLLSSTSHLDVDKQLYAQASAIPIAPPPFPLLGIAGQRLRTGDVFSQELRASGSNERLSWVAGAYYRESTTVLDMNLKGGFTTPFLFIVSRTEQQSKAWSVFGNAQYKLTDAWEVGVGLRYFRDRRASDDTLADVFQSGDFESVSPRLFLKYNFSPNQNVYASVAKGFRSGGFNSLGTPNYGPETAWTYELGAKMSGDGGRKTAEIVLFHTSYKDVQVLSITDPITLSARFSNAGVADINGAELSLARTFDNHVELGLNANYTKSEFNEVNPLSTHAVGDRLDFVPEYGIVAWASYSFTLPGDISAYARADYSLQGPSTYRNRTAGDFFFGESDKIELLNLSLEAELNDWRVELFGSNLLDEHGAIDPTGIEGYHAVNRPRTFGVSISRNF